MVSEFHRMQRNLSDMPDQPGFYYDTTWSVGDGRQAISTKFSVSSLASQPQALPKDNSISRGISNSPSMDCVTLVDACSLSKVETV